MNITENQIRGRIKELYAQFRKDIDELCADYDESGFKILEQILVHDVSKLALKEESEAAPTPEEEALLEDLPEPSEEKPKKSKSKAKPKAKSKKKEEVKDEAIELEGDIFDI